MTRWEPDTRRRLQESALALIGARGLDAVTAGEIAAGAGVTERTFFRHFGDKREAVFGNRGQLEAAILGGVRSGGIEEGLRAAADDLAPRRAQLLAFDALLQAHPALRERDLAKQADLAAAVGGALRDDLAGELFVVILRVGYRRWLRDGGDLEELLSRTHQEVEYFKLWVGSATSRR